MATDMTIGIMDNGRGTESTQSLRHLAGLGAISSAKFDAKAAREICAARNPWIH